MRTAKALVRLRECAGSPEPSLVACVISTISHELAHIAFIKEWFYYISLTKCCFKDYHDTTYMVLKLYYLDFESYMVAYFLILIDH